MCTVQQSRLGLFLSLLRFFLSYIPGKYEAKLKFSDARGIGFKTTEPAMGGEDIIIWNNIFGEGYFKAVQWISNYSLERRRSWITNPNCSWHWWMQVRCSWYYRLLVISACIWYTASVGCDKLKQQHQVQCENVTSVECNLTRLQQSLKMFKVSKGAFHLEI